MDFITNQLTGRNAKKIKSHTVAHERAMEEKLFVDEMVEHVRVEIQAYQREQQEANGGVIGQVTEQLYRQSGGENMEQVNIHPPFLLILFYYNYFDLQKICTN